MKMCSLPQRTSRVRGFVTKVCDITLSFCCTLLTHGDEALDVSVSRVQRVIVRMDEYFVEWSVSLAFAPINVVVTSPVL